MTGWEKVAALAGLYVVGMAWANTVMLRRVRGAVAVRATWTAAAFDAVFADLDPRVAPAVRDALAPLYGAGVVPRPEDTLRRFLKLDRGEIEDLAAALADRLDAAVDPLLLPDLPDVAALTRYVGARLRGPATRAIGRSGPVPYMPDDRPAPSRAR
jgi:hypothetical protein